LLPVLSGVTGSLGDCAVGGEVARGCILASDFPMDTMPRCQPFATGHRRMCRSQKRKK
jgi:hypothetical protein